MAAQKYDLTPENVRIIGRCLSLAGGLWPGTPGAGVEFWTDASVVRADVLGISETKRREDFSYLGVFLDGEERPYRKLMIRTEMHTVDILRNPEKKMHRVRIVKLTETQYDKLCLSVLTADAALTPTAPPRRRILFVGDSLTAGYGLGQEHELSEDPMAYQFTTEDEDVTRSYAWLTARALHAQGQYFAWSGNGVISQWIPPEIETPYTENLLPSLYPYVDKTTETFAKIYLKAKGWKEPAGSYFLTRYNPQSFPADVLVFALGTNDASFTRGVPTREQHFMNRYAEFIRDVRAQYPNAVPIVICGMMETGLMDACQEAASLAEADFLPLPLMNPMQDGIGGGGHPGPASHRLWAEILTSRILQRTGWERDLPEETPPEPKTEITKPETEESRMERTYTVTITMKDGGVMRGVLYPDIAPITVENFKKLSDEKFYDGLTFHRIIKGFMIQGGDPEGNGTGGPGYSIKGEFAANGVQNDLKHTRGVLSMARAQDPNSAGSQFFIMHADAPYLDGQYAAFGKITEGLDVLDRIADVKTNFMDAPWEPQVIESIVVE